MAEFSSPSPLTTVGISPPFVEGLGFDEILEIADSGIGGINLFKTQVAERIFVKNIRMQFITSAVVANRIPQVLIFDGDGNQIWQAAPNAGQAASLTIQYNYSPVFSASVSDSASIKQVPFPGFYLMPGWTVQINITGRQAGDVVSFLNVWRHRLVVGQGGYDLGRQP